MGDRRESPRLLRPLTTGSVMQSNQRDAPKYVYPPLYSPRYHPTTNLNLNPPENDQSIKLDYLFHTYTQSVKLFIEHNKGSLRAQSNVSQLLLELERLFGAFSSQIIKQRGSLNVSIGSYATPFLRLWHQFSKKIFSLHKTTPSNLIDQISTLFKVISDSLDSVLRASSASVHANSPKNILVLQRRLGTLQKQAYRYLSHISPLSDNAVLSENVKTFSRLLSEALSMTGGSQNELARARSRSYSACSDILRILQQSYIFETDFSVLTKNFDDFQECLALILDNYGIQLNYLYKRDEMQAKNDEEAKEDEIDESLSFFDLLEISMENSKFKRILRAKADDMYKDIEKLKEHLKIEKENHKLKKSKIRNLVFEREQEIADLNAEIDGLCQEILEKKKEIEELKVRNAENPFKTAFRNVAKNLGAAMREESINFENEDDDELIEKVASMSVYVVDRKCKVCEKRDIEEKMLREEFSGLFDIDETIEFPLFLEKFRENVEIELGNKKLREEENALLRKLNDHFQNIIEGICEAVGIEFQINDSVVDSVKEKLREREADHHKKIEEAEGRSKQRVEDYEKQLAELYDVEGPDIINLVKEKRAKEVEDAKIQLKKHQELVKSVNKYLRLQTYTDDLDQLIDTLAGNEHPLAQNIKETELKFLNARSALDTLIGRLCGILGTNIVSVGDDNYVAQIVPILDKIQDHIGKLNKTLNLQKSDMLNFREFIENIDLKLHKHLKIQDTDISRLNLKALLVRVDEFCDQITKMDVTPGFYTNEDILSTVKPILELENILPSNQPKEYLSEIVSSYFDLHRSLNALKPFSSILEEAFISFDGKFENFKPNSPSYVSLKAAVFKLHEALNSISPAKVNTLVFVVLSRFIALVSAFLSAVSALSVTSPSEVNELVYSLQRENERLQLDRI